MVFINNFLITILFCSNGFLSSFTGTTRATEIQMFLCDNQWQHQLETRFGAWQNLQTYLFDTQNTIMTRNIHCDKYSTLIGAGYSKKTHDELWHGKDCCMGIFGS